MTNEAMKTARMVPSDRPSLSRWDVSKSRMAWQADTFPHKCAISTTSLYSTTNSF